MYNDELFSQEFYNESQVRKERLINRIQSYDMATILATPTEELVKYFEGEYQMVSPQLKLDELHLLDTPKEVTSRERVRDDVWDDEYVNVNRNYIQFTVCLPFEGESSLLSLRPSSYTYTLSGKMNASVQGNEIRISYQVDVSNAQSSNPASFYESDVKMLETNIQHLARDVAGFNREISAIIPQKLNERKQSAEKNQSIIQSFKIPVKKRENVPETYKIPEIRKKPNVVENPKTKTFTPEPTLSIEEYENILRIIKDMALAMERSPRTFTKLSEEEIRDFFIILLNGHYQGGATSETFNGVGKTDILIRHKNANAFIAECKFWKGQKKTSETIDQLLKYVTWRDTKTAVLLFNKLGDLSAVAEKAQEIFKKHPLFKSEIKLSAPDLQNNETIFGYKFKHPSDQAKEVFITLMIFQIDGSK